MRYRHDDGSVVLETEQFSLKIESDRLVYAKKPSDSKFQSLEFKAPRGLTRSQKEAYLLNLHQQLRARLEEQSGEE